MHFQFIIKQEKTMPIVRAEKNSNQPFAVINQAAIRSKELSWQSTGMLVYLLQLPDRWNIDLDNLTAVKPGGKDRVYTCLKQLEQFGYLSKRQTRDKKGRIKKVEYTVFEDPNDNPQFNKRYIR